MSRHQLTLFDCVGSVAKQQRVASDPCVSPTHFSHARFVQVHDDHSDNDADTGDDTHLSLPTRFCTPSPCTTPIVSCSGSDEGLSPAASFSNLEESMMSTSPDLTTVAGTYHK